MTTKNGTVAALAALCALGVAGAADASTKTKWDLELEGYACVDTTINDVALVLCIECDANNECDVQVCDADGSHCDNMMGPEASALYHQSYFFEAEAGTLAAPLQSVAASGASHGAAVTVPATATASGGSVGYAFSTAASGSFSVWARVRTPSTSADTVVVRFDAQSSVSWTLPVTGSEWQWVRLDAGGAARTFSLGAGAHALRLYTPEHGLSVDRLLVTDNPTYVPRVATYEAESGAIAAPMQVASYGWMPRTSYVWVPNGSGAGGLVAIPAPMPTGYYAVWGRINAASGYDNAFLVSSDFGTTVSWQLPVTGANAWAWSRVDVNGGPYPFALDDNGFVQVNRAEDGAKLDKILVTNDPGFMPVEPTVTSTAP